MHIQFMLNFYYRLDTPRSLGLRYVLLTKSLVDSYQPYYLLQVLVIGLPIQYILVTIMIKQRQKCVAITDKRVRLTSEILQGIRLIKAYGWENFYAQKVTGLREQEIGRIKKSSYV